MKGKANMLRREIWNLWCFQNFIDCLKRQQRFQVNSFVYLYIGSRGRFHQLVRNTGAKREKRDSMNNQRYEEDKGADDLLEEKEQKIQQLTTQLDEFAEVCLENDENMRKLAKLFDAGIIDENGEPIQNNRNE